MKYICLIYILFFPYHIKAQVFKAELTLKNLLGESVTINTEQMKGYRLYAFLSTTCPLCINYTKSMKEFTEKFRNDAEIYLIFSGSHQRKGDIKKFLKKYGLNNAVLLDPKYELSESLSATITPEVFLLNGNQVIYSGAIDDWVIDLGQKKPHPEQFYLQDAITSSLNGVQPEISRVKAIGCFIR